MKKRLSQVILLLGITAVTWNVNHNLQKSSNQFSDLTLENIDALAQEEIGTGGICYQNVEYDHVFPNKYILYCGECRFILGYSYWNTSFCLQTL